MTIQDWPAAERPREKLLSRGAAALSDAELLAIFLRTGVRGKTAVDLARELLAKFGSLRKLLHASRHEVCAMPGLGPLKFIQLQAALELGQRHLQEILVPGETLPDARHTKRFLVSRLRDYAHEVFACLFLDMQNRVLQFEELFHGTINEASIYPREVVKRGLVHNAAKVIFAHNHPSGKAEASPADIEITGTLKQALDLVGIQVLDHIIIGDSQAVSMAQMGYL